MSVSAKDWATFERLLGDVRRQTSCRCGEFYEDACECGATAIRDALWAAEQHMRRVCEPEPAPETSPESEISF